MKAIALTSILLCGSALATNAMAVDAGLIRSFEKDGKISYLVSDDAVAAAPPAGIILPAPADGPHACDQRLYPAMSARFYEQGKVLLSMEIDPQGKIRNLSVQQPNSHPRLNEASLDCVRNWAYRPALRNGVPVAAEHTVELTWQLRR